MNDFFDILVWNPSKDADCISCSRKLHYVQSLYYATNCILEKERSPQVE